MIGRQFNPPQNSLPQNTAPVYIDHIQRGPVNYPSHANPVNYVRIQQGSHIQYPPQNQMPHAGHEQLRSTHPNTITQHRQIPYAHNSQHIQHTQQNSQQISQQHSQKHSQQQLQQQPVPQITQVPQIPSLQEQQYSGHNYTQENDGQEEQNYQINNHNNEQNSQEQDQDAQHKQILLFWEHKFFTIFQRFQIIHDKVQWMRTQFYNLNNQLKVVDSEVEWNQAKQHHDDYMEQIEQFSQELAGVLNQNIALYEQQQRQNDEEGIWRKRYYQLFQSYKSLQVQNVQLRETNPNPPNHHQNQQDQRKIDQLLQAYRQLQKQYTTTVNQLNQYKQSSNNNQQLNQYRQRLDYTLNEAERYKDILERLHEQNNQMNKIISDLREENQNLVIAVENAQNGNNDGNADYNGLIANKDNEINKVTNQLNQLRSEFKQLFYEKQSSQNNLVTDIQQKTIEIQRLKEQSQQLSKTIEQKNKQLKSLEFMKLDIQKHEQKNRNLSAKMQEKQNMVRTRNKQYDLLAMQLREKNKQNRELSNQIQRLKIDIISLQNRRKTIVEKSTFNRQFENRLKVVEQEYQSKIVSLKRIIKEKQESTQMNALMIIKLEALEKKNKNLLNQIEKLNSQNIEKDKQLLDYRRSTYENQKLKQLQSQFHVIIDEKQSLNAEILQKNLQIDNLQNSISQFEQRIKSLGTRSNAINSKSLALEIEQLNNIIHHKQSQNNKLRSGLNLKLSEISDLEIQLQKCKTYNAGRQREDEIQRGIFEKKIKDLEKRNQESEKKIRELEYDYGSKMKNNLEEEIRSLRIQNQNKQENIIRLQANQLQLQSRIAHYQRIRGTVTSDLEEMANKTRQIQNNKIQMIKKIENAYKDVKRKDKEIKQRIDNQKYLKMNLLNMENKYKETQNMAEQKQKIINDLQSKLLLTNSRLNYLTEEHDKLRMRRRDETDMLVKQSDDLKRKIYELQSSSVQGTNNERNQFLQEKIRQLTQEKQFLRNQLASALNKLGEQGFPSQRFEPNGNKSKGSEGIDYIQQRLFQFNEKIDKMIVKNKQLAEFNNNSNIQTIERSVANQVYQDQISNLKKYIEELRKYCSKLEIEAGGQIIRPNPKYSMVFIEQQKANTDRYNFFKKHHDELESRIQKLLEINSGLKDRIDSLLRGDRQSTSEAFYNDHFDQAQKTIQNLNQKVNKLIEQNQILKSNNSQNNMKMYRGYEDRIFECENKIFELERKITTLEVQKNKSESQKLTLSRDKNAVKADLQITMKKASKCEDQKQLLEKQLQTLEGEISQIMGKMRVAQSENNRLTQALHSSFSQQNILLNTPNKSPIRPHYY